MRDFLGKAGAGAALAPDPMARLLRVMAVRGTTHPPAVFHTAVKVAFFSSGAATYDEVSRNLWESLPEQFQRLASDYLSQYAPVSAKMTALDAGCGTGLSAELLLRTRFGAFVRQIDLLDPSEEMLELCSARESLRAIRHRPVLGVIQDLPSRGCYDVVVAGCVLQHISDLPDFLRNVSLRQRPGGIFLHVQDPNGDYGDDPERLYRVARLARSRRVSPATMLKRLSAANPWGGRRHKHALADQVERINFDLLRRRVISSKMSEGEIRAVVDLPSYDVRGLSLREMQRLLPEYDLVSSRSYAFFGELVSDLPPAYRELERELIEQRAMNGSQVAAVWMKTSRPKS